MIYSSWYIYLVPVTLPVYILLVYILRVMIAAVMSAEEYWESVHSIRR